MAANDTFVWQRNAANTAWIRVAITPASTSVSGFGPATVAEDLPIGNGLQIDGGGNLSLASLPAAQMFVGNPSNVATPVAMSGEVTIGTAGGTTINKAITPTWSGFHIFSNDGAVPANVPGSLSHNQYPVAMVYDSAGGVCFGAFNYGGTSGWAGFDSGVANGTLATPANTSNGTQLTSLGGIGYETTNGWGGGTAAPHPAGLFAVYSAENFAAGHHGTYATIETTAIGAAVSARAIRLQAGQGVAIGSAVCGGSFSDPGDGNLVTSGTVNGLTIGKGLGSVLGNTALGSGALAAITSGGFNTGAGDDALNSETTGVRNTAFGYGTLANQIGASDNTAMGSSAGLNLSSGSANSALGSFALEACATGSNNMAFGTYALKNITTTGDNIGIGYNAGRYITGGSTSNTISQKSLYIGSWVQAAADGDTNEIVIGYNAVGLGSNTTVIGNSNTTAAKIWGALTVTSTLTTADPANGAGAWLLGKVRTGIALAVSAVTGIQVKVDGVEYTLPVLTTNP